MAPAEDDLTAEMVRTITALQREVRWLRRERAERLGEVPAGADLAGGAAERSRGAGLAGGSDPHAGAETPPWADDDAWMLAVLAPAAPTLAARMAVEDGAIPYAQEWDLLPPDPQRTYLRRARTVLAEVAPLCREAFGDVPGPAHVRLALHRLGLPPGTDIPELLEHARAEGAERAAREAADDVAPLLVEVRTLRQALQAVELVVVAGERMAGDHPSAVAAEVATWFTERLRRALAAPDVTLSDALVAEREQVLLAVADHLGYTGMDALDWFAQVSSRIDAAEDAERP
ncbi:hypothetical protein [Georgenia wangjunii]|uniref:hypothetical protein n=1 Tax=Georgenia wangjunii TaxID=3117730 RepID=UPI002F26746D